MQVIERLTDLLEYVSSHLFGNRFELSLCKVLLQITPWHVFHHDADHIFNCELLFEPDHVGAVFGTRLELDLTCDLSFAKVVKRCIWYDLHCEFLIGLSMLCQHNLAESAIAQLLNQIILIEPVLEALLSQEHTEALLLQLMGLEVE